MKKVNVYKAGAAAAAFISVIGICAFCFRAEGHGEDGETVIRYEDYVATDAGSATDKEEQYRIFLQKEMESMIESSEYVSDCHIDFEVSDNAITKVDVSLEIVESYDGDEEALTESIRKAVASAAGIPVENVSVGR